MYEISDVWHLRFLNLAKNYSTWSKDPSTKIGAVIARGKDPLSFGYNGFSERFYDDPCLLNNREEKYKYTIHAEKNAIIKAAKKGVDIVGASLYVYGLPPCLPCAIEIDQSGIDYVYWGNDNRVFSKEDQFEDVPDRWKKSVNETSDYFKRTRIEMRRI